MYVSQVFIFVMYIPILNGRLQYTDTQLYIPMMRYIINYSSQLSKRALTLRALLDNDTAVSVNYISVFYCRCIILERVSQSSLQLVKVTMLIQEESSQVRKNVLSNYIQYEMGWYNHSLSYCLVIKLPCCHITASQLHTDRQYIAIWQLLASWSDHSQV